MPTYVALARFLRDYEALTPEQQALFRRALAIFIKELREGKGFRKGLRVKRVRGTEDVFEMTWAPNGRATWEYGEEVRPGERHIIWRRIGTHDIFNNA